MPKQHSLSAAIVAATCASMLVLAGCNQQPSSNQGSAPASSASAPASASSAQAQQQAYTPPTADQLYQMVAPIALFPDKLVAQVLAGSTYPDEVTAAQNLVAQNPNLKGDLLQAAVEPQSWDASVKGLTQFPSVLSQMAQNIQWTTALGQAYVNDPTDVLNAIQVMRQRARAQGNLQNSAQQAVTVQPAQAVEESEQQAGYVANSDAPPVYSGPDVVPPPSSIIQIDPSQSGEVYVPSYDPQTVYGGEVPYYPSYEYEQPRYTTGEVVTVGAVAFGAAILVGTLMNHGDHDHGDRGGGWHSWGMNWGGSYGGGGGGPRRPAVVYNNQTYVSRSTTVVNRYTTINNYNNRTVNNVTNNRNQFNATNNVSNNNRPAAQPMNTPNFGRAGYVSAAAPHAPVAEQRAVQEARANAMHPTAPAAQRPAFAPRPQETIRQPVPRPQPAIHAVPQAQPHPQPAVHAAPHAQPHAQPAFHPAPQAHPQPAVHAAPQAHPAPHPAPAPQVHRPAPAPAQHAAPAPHAAPAHPAQQHPQNNGHQPPKKKDESHG